MNRAYNSRCTKGVMRKIGVGKEKAKKEDDEDDDAIELNARDREEENTMQKVERRRE